MQQFSVDKLLKEAYDIVRCCVMRTVSAIFVLTENTRRTSEGANCWQPTASEIDELVSGLHNLRERLVTDVNRIQDDIMQYAALGQAIARLTQIGAESMARVTGLDFAKER